MGRNRPHQAGMSTAKGDGAFRNAHKCAQRTASDFVHELKSQTNQGVTEVSLAGGIKFTEQRYSSQKKKEGSER